MALVPIDRIGNSGTVLPPACPKVPALLAAMAPLIKGSKLAIAALIVLGAAARSVQAIGGRVVDRPNINYSSEPYWPASMSAGTWYNGSATFYQLGSNSGACGYPRDLVDEIYYAATPDPRWSDTLSRYIPDFSGAVCGQCFEIMCQNEPRYAHEVFCRDLQPRPIKVRITDADAHKTAAPGTPGGWPNNHFDLKPEAFSAIADPIAGIINIKWRRVPCNPTLQPKWTRWSGSNPWWHDIVVWDVPGSGNVYNVKVRPAGVSEWLDTKWGWGAHFWLTRYAKIDGTTQVVIDVGLKGRVSLAAKYVQTAD